MSLLTMVQRVCKRVGLATPSVAYTSTDPQVLQIVEFCNEEGQELSERYPWQALRIQSSFTTLAAQLQTDVETVAPGFKYVINDTMWDRTLRRPVYGAVNPQVWEMMEGQNLIGPWYQYTIRGGDIYFFPVPQAGDSIYFEYQSANFASNAAGTTTDSVFNADDDYALLDESIMIQGVVWRWKNAKGLEYGEDFNKYESRVADAMARDGTKAALSMSEQRNYIEPVVMIPSGSWNV